MLDEQTSLTSAAWLSLQVSFKQDSRKVLLVLTLKTKFKLHTVWQSDLLMCQAD